jgi:CheY-like chemotaxis protein
MPVQYHTGSLLNDIITLNMIRIESKPITFNIEIDEKIPCELYGDELRLKQIFNNLLSNAFKYTREGSVTLGVSCQREGDKDIWMSVTVSDTGIGIRPDDLKKLFSDYSQVDMRANRNIEGTGLGLSITKKLVELMGGEISVDSEYGRGSTFRFRVRQAFINDRALGSKAVESLRTFNYLDKKQHLSPKLVRLDMGYAKVLLVDDMQTNLDVVSGLLRKYKIQVDCVTTGRDAIDRIKSGEPVYTAVFMDHMMPGMDGLEATGHIRALGSEYARTVPIIALTANAIAGNERMFLESGFQAFLSKPFDIRKLDSILRQWVRDKSKETT